MQGSVRMGVAAKLTLIVAMVAIVLGAQLLEREIAARREPAIAAAKRAGIVLGATDPDRPPIAALTAPLPEAVLPDVPAGSPESGAASGTPGIDDVAAGGNGERTYVVQPGDTLSRIARRMLGHEAAWQLIYQRNRAVIPDAARLKVGAALEIPLPARSSGLASAPRDRARAKARHDAQHMPRRKLTTAPRAR
ncbi:MAG: LysM peptidoglycan-binding domain-containing protein [Polyangiaceae bacterium]